MVVKDKGHARSGAIHALSEMGQEAREAIPAITQALTDQDKEVHEMAVGALKKIEGTEKNLFSNP